MTEPEISASIDRRSRETYHVWSTVHPRYGDLDTNAHINNGAINGYFEEARVMLRRQIMHVENEIEGQFTGFVIVKFTVQYLAPLFYPGDFDIGTSVEDIGRTSYTLAHGLFDGDRCAALAEAVLVGYDAGTGKAVPIDEEYRKLIETIRIGTKS